jgi:hypothetical protein
LGGLWLLGLVFVVGVVGWGLGGFWCGLLR